MSALGGTAEVLEHHREAWGQVARRSGVAALAGSHTGHEHAVVFLPFRLVRGRRQNQIHAVGRRDLLIRHGGAVRGSTREPKTWPRSFTVKLSCSDAR